MDGDERRRRGGAVRRRKRDLQAERLTEVISMRLTASEAEAISLLADQDRDSMSNTMRRAIQEYVSRRTSNWIPADATETTNPARPRWRFAS
jgi:hypothetical protein